MYLYTLCKKWDHLSSSLYMARKKPNLAIARYKIFRKKKKLPERKNLPPTDANVLPHSKRAHLQFVLWKSADTI